MDAIHVAALFTMIVRLADSLGWDVPPVEVFAARAGPMLGEGYVLRTLPDGASAPASRDGDGLPDAVGRYLERALPPGGRVPRRVRITQAGELWRTPGGRPLRFTAVQEIAVDEVAFEWRARFPVLPLVPLRITDGYRAGIGRMDGKVLGIPIMRSRGPDIDLGAAMRYLAEMMWAPHAMLANRTLEWRQLDGRAAEVATRVGSARVAVRLGFDEAGDLVACSADSRPRDGDAPRPWGATCSAYASLGGIRIPTKAEVYWQLPEGRFTYFRCTVTSLELAG